MYPARGILDNTDVNPSLFALQRPDAQCRGLQSKLTGPSPQTEQFKDE